MLAMTYGMVLEIVLRHVTHAMMCAKACAMISAMTHTMKLATCAQFGFRPQCLDKVLNYGLILIMECYT